MSCVVVTGASGFIGQELVSALGSYGHRVVALGRRPRAGSGQLSWQLGEDLPPDCATAEAIVHLASATLIETGSVKDAVWRDV